MLLPLLASSGGIVLMEEVAENNNFITGDRTLDNLLAVGGAPLSDTNGHFWAGSGTNAKIERWLETSPAINTLTIRVAANVPENYWSTLVWVGQGVVMRGDRTSFTAWNGTYTEWVFAGDPLNMEGSGATAALLIYT